MILLRCLVVAGAFCAADGFRVLASRSRSLVQCHAGAKQGGGGGRSAAQQTVFVRNVAFDADAQSLRTAMEDAFGPVANVWLPMNENAANQNKGYGKVTFGDSASTGTALEAGGVEVNGRKIKIIESTNTPAASVRGGGMHRGALFQQLRASRRRDQVETIIGRLGELTDVKEASMAISAWGRVRDWKRALEQLSEMQERGLVPNVITYSAAISACAKGSQWERALELLSEMQERGLKPSVITYNAAISACEKGSQWERALALLSDMQERGLEPNVITHNAAISACEKGSQWERALKLLSEMRERGIEPNVITYSAAISACKKGSQWERALKLLSRCENAGSSRT